MQKNSFQIDLKKFLSLKRLKKLCCGYTLLVILVVNVLRKKWEKPNQKEFRVENVKLYGYQNSFNYWIDKKAIEKMSEYFFKPKPMKKILSRFS